MNVCIVIGHPRPASFCAALAAAYAEGARRAGCAVAVVDLARLAFDADVHPPSPRDQPLEPPLAAALATLEAAEHWLIVLPAWWGVGPARLWGFFDRVLLPGRAFAERAAGDYEGLLAGRSAHLIVTTDMPPAVYRWLFGAPALRALARCTLGVCGVATTHAECVGPVTHSTPAERQKWLERASDMGFSLSKSVHAANPWQPAKAWVRALRLQFYPMAWMAYTAGALAAAPWGAMDGAAYALGYAFLFALEAATVFINDRVDLQSDRHNRHHGPFTGGSRVLVDGALTLRENARGTALALAAAALFAALLLARVPDAALAAAAGALTLVALGYTAPPARLAWRGWGELAVGVTHSVGVIAVGYLAQRGAPGAAAPWLIALPLGVAVVPAIVLAGVPDAAADAAVGKRTLAVRLGRRRALGLALVLAWAALACAAAVARWASEPAAGALLPVLPAALALIAPLSWHLVRAAHDGGADGRIDAPLVLALLYLTLFALLPLLALWRG